MSLFAFPTHVVFELYVNLSGWSLTICTVHIDYLIIQRVRQRGIFWPLPQIGSRAAQTSYVRHFRQCNIPFFQAEKIEDYGAALRYCLHARGGCAPSLLWRGNKCFQWSPLSGGEAEVPCRRWDITQRFVCEMKDFRKKKRRRRRKWNQSQNNPCQSCAIK